MSRFNKDSTWAEVADMSLDEAIEILQRDAKSDGKDWSARPHKAKAAQIAIWAIERIRDLTPCDGCAFNPPSSLDGKPCTMCPATGVYDA